MENEAYSVSDIGENSFKHIKLNNNDRMVSFDIKNWLDKQYLNLLERTAFFELTHLL